MDIKHHPVQLHGLMVRELFIRVNDPKASSEEQSINTDEEETGEFSFGVGHSDFDSSDNTIDVGILITIGNPDDPCHDGEEEAPFDLKVHLLAKFFIDTGNFPVEQIEHWAEHNAPLILHPYVREHVYSLTIKAGVRPVLLPLMQVPTFSINKSNK